MLRAGGGRNRTHAVLTKLAGTPLSPCANLAKGAVTRSAKFFCCFRSSLKQTFAGRVTSVRSSLKQTSAGRVTSVHSSLCWRNTPDRGWQVIDLEYLVIRLWMWSTLSTLRSLSKLRKQNVLTLQRGKLSTNAACSHKFYMSYTLLKYWVDWHLCLSVILASSHSPCARRHATFMEHPATRRKMLVTAIDGGTSQCCHEVGHQSINSLVVILGNTN